MALNVTNCHYLTYLNSFRKGLHLSFGGVLIFLVICRYFVYLKRKIKPKMFKLIAKPNIVNALLNKRIGCLSARRNFADEPPRVEKSKNFFDFNVSI